MKKASPLKAIRMKCLDCSCGQPGEVRECLITDCALHPYRFGHNPGRKGIGGGFARKSVVECGDIAKEQALRAGVNVL